jgi:hypothetical protein
VAKERKLKITFIITALALVAATGVFIYTSYQDSMKEQAAHPVQGHNQVVKQLREYHKKVGSFPQNFQQLQDVVWHYPQGPKLGDGGRSFTMGNYYYLLGYINPHTVTLWATPIGRYYKDAPAFYVVLRPDDFDYWKGPALDLSQVATLNVNPTEAQLASLLMTAQPSAVKQQSKK